MFVARKSPPRGSAQRGHRHGIALPEVGQWYQCKPTGLFEVVAVDIEDASIEIQHFDGTIEELDFRGWIAQKASPAAAPEDWSGSVDISNEDHPDPSHHVTLTLDDSLNLIEQEDDPSEDWLSVITPESLRADNYN